MVNSKWKEFLLILLLAIPFLFWGIGSFSFLDPDEGLYGTIAREMAEGGDWITPHFNGVRYLEKPPLYFWLSSLTIAAFGPSEWAVRLWSALPALGTALLLWRMGIWFYGEYGGILSAIVFITSVGVFRYVRVAATDFLSVFSITLSMFGFARAELFGRRGRREYLLFYLGAALGVLSKGLIGVVFPLLFAGLFLWIAGDGEKRVGDNHWLKLKNGFRRLFTICRSLLFNRGVLLFLLLTLPWHLLAAWKNSGFLWFYFVDNQLLRFLNARNFIEDDVSMSTLSFLGLALVWFFPWSLFLPRAIRQSFVRARASAPRNEFLRLLVAIWAVGILVFFSLSSSKLEHYSLPAIAPLSLMVGGLWAEAFADSSLMLGLKYRLSVTVLCCSLVGGMLLFLGGRLTSKDILAGLAAFNVYYRILQQQGHDLPLPVAPLIQLLKGLGVVVLLGTPVAFALYYLRRAKECFGVFVGIAAAIAVLVLRLVFLIEPYHSSKFVAAALEARLKPGDSIVHEGSLEYSGGLPFYTGRNIYVLNGRRGDLDFGFRYPETQYLYLDNKKFAQLWESPRRVFLVTRSAQETVISRLLAKKIFLVGRYGSRWLYTNQQTAHVQ